MLVEFCWILWVDLNHIIFKIVIVFCLFSFLTTIKQLFRFFKIIFNIKISLLISSRIHVNFDHIWAFEIFFRLIYFKINWISLLHFIWRFGLNFFNAWLLNGCWFFHNLIRWLFHLLVSLIYQKFIANLLI